MAYVLWSMIRATYPDKGEHRPGRTCESVVCPPRGTRIELVCHADSGRGGVPYISLSSSSIFYAVRTCHFKHDDSKTKQNK